MARMMLALWRTVTRDKLELVFSLLRPLVQAGALPPGHTEVYFDEVLTIHGVLNYAQRLVMDDRFWENIAVPAPAALPFTKKRLAKYPPELAALLKGTPLPRSWADIRSELNFFLTLCDQDVSFPTS